VNAGRRDAQVSERRRVDDLKVLAALDRVAERSSAQPMLLSQIKRHKTRTNVGQAGVVLSDTFADRSVTGCDPIVRWSRAVPDGKVLRTGLHRGGYERKL
jgi:hypothetical protein